MTMQFVTDYINKKINENPNYIRYTFYELDQFLRMNRDYFENKGYNVYFTGAKFEYNNTKITVQDNELMIAIKE